MKILEKKTRGGNSLVHKIGKIMTKVKKKNNPSTNCRWV